MPGRFMRRVAWFAVLGMVSPRIWADPPEPLPRPLDAKAAAASSSPWTVNASQLAGVPEDVQPQVVSLHQAYALALLRIRTPKEQRLEDRAAILIPQAWVERTAYFRIADFARFSEDFRAVALDRGRFHDPADRYFELLEKAFQVACVRWDIAQLEKDRQSLAHSGHDHPSGITQMHLDSNEQILLDDRRELSSLTEQYQDLLLQFKGELDLPIETFLTLDHSSLEPFFQVFRKLDRWTVDPHRQADDLPAIVGRLPELEDLAINGRSVLGAFHGTNADQELLLRAAWQAIPTRGTRRDSTVPDQRKLTVRRQVRHLQDLADQYRNERNKLLLTYRYLLSASRELIPAPAPNEKVSLDDESGTLWINGRSQSSLVLSRTRSLVEKWFEYQTARQALMRDLALLPYGTWGSYLSALLPRPGLGVPTRTASRPAPTRPLPSPRLPSPSAGP